MLKITGYTDRPSLRPGERVEFKISCEGGAGRYRARIVRLICGDDGPASPGYKVHPVDAKINGSYPGRRQTIDIGSYVTTREPADILSRGDFTLVALVLATSPDKGTQQTILACQEAVATNTGRQRGIVLGLDRGGAASITIWDGANQAVLSSGEPLLAHRWYLLAASIDPETQRLTLLQRPLDPAFGEPPRSGGGTTATFDLSDLAGTYVTAAASVALRPDRRRHSTHHFDGKIEAPAIFAGLIDFSALDYPTTLNLTRYLTWDFSRDMGGRYLNDLSGHGHDAEIVNLPTRAVTGAHWRSQTTHWHERPDLYGAIHFHCDDLYDMGWATDFAWVVPADLASGIYACELTTDDGGEDIVPFFVLPPKGKVTASLAFLASTFTYLAYANSHHGYEDSLSEVCYGSLLELGPTEQFLKERRDYGVSLYDRHRDGSGSCHSSWHRPILNSRPKRAIWNFNADLHIIDWLHAIGQPYDIITDDKLHEEGAELLKRYRCIVTGTHPEYHSTAMMDALEEYQRDAGRIIYTGGNGFYWRIATHPDWPGAIELRRGEAGTRCYELPPGERFHAWGGEFGGLWRSQGRAPQKLFGVGFVTEGFDASSYYVRLADSFDPRASFIFEGINDDEKIGNFGILGGAAGLELDASDPELGTPRHALILAKSVEHSNVFLLTPEEMLAGFPGLDAIENDKCRAELVFFETPSGGAVFATGSIGWASSLSHARYDNNVSRLTLNVLRRFLDPKPFV
ncbi:N,N-dimethylformamidase beta subunit family domain-containing protein [Dongia sp.]|uniref:N,N-dimethylformamidase beta subunit family domain-containing protein n=1 Tax=Dongia sp. TaxID=1977262 RepID=UPI0035B08955